MDKQAIFEQWAPQISVWSVWAKPVLFAHLPRSLCFLLPMPVIEIDWVPPTSERWAIVVDLPGKQSVAMGLALAELGYRPVPLFNACPPTPAQDSQTGRYLGVVDVDEILTALVNGCDQLRSLNLPSDAPPAFLVDSSRQPVAQLAKEGLFDNRSVMFVTDFPSTNFLASQKIQRAIVVRQQPGMERDLMHAMQTWKKGGVSLFEKSLDNALPPKSITLSSPSALAGFWLRVWAWLDFRRSPLGGFGAFVPESSGGSGG